MIDLIKPPTDNLYKFAAVFGLVLFVGGLFFPPWLFHQSGLELLKAVAGNKELAVYETLGEERKQQLKTRTQQAETQLKQLQDRISHLASSRNSHSDEIDKLESAIKDANKRLETLEDASYEFNLNLELKKAQVREQQTLSINETRDSRLVMVVGWVFAALGVVIAVRGFVMWYRRVQVFQDTNLKVEVTSKDASATRSEADAAQTNVSQAEASQTNAVQTEVPPSDTTHTEEDEAPEREDV